MLTLNQRFKVLPFGQHVSGGWAVVDTQHKDEQVARYESQARALFEAAKLSRMYPQAPGDPDGTWQHALEQSNAELAQRATALVTNHAGNGWSMLKLWRHLSSLLDAERYLATGQSDYVWFCSTKRPVNRASIERWIARAGQSTAALDIIERDSFYLELPENMQYRVL